MISQPMMDKEDKLLEKTHKSSDVAQLRVDVFKLLNELANETLGRGYVREQRVSVFADDLLGIFLKEGENRNDR